MLNGWRINYSNSVSDIFDVSGNIINGNIFGLQIYGLDNYILDSIGLFINNKRFGCFDDYLFDGSIDEEYSGIYYNSNKVI